jgi:hypothetical protein
MQLFVNVSNVTGETGVLKGFNVSLVGFSEVMLACRWLTTYWTTLALSTG